jgi:hypothetical protein
MKVYIRHPKGGFTHMVAQVGMTTECGNEIVGVNGESCRVKNEETGQTRIYTDVVITLAEAREHGYGEGGERTAPPRAVKAVERSASKKGVDKPGSGKKTAHKSKATAQTPVKQTSRKARAGR